MADDQVRQAIAEALRQASAQRAHPVAHAVGQLVGTALPVGVWLLWIGLVLGLAWRLGRWAAGL